MVRKVSPVWDTNLKLEETTKVTLGRMFSYQSYSGPRSKLTSTRGYHQQDGKIIVSVEECYGEANIKTSTIRDVEQGEAL